VTAVAGPARIEPDLALAEQLFAALRAASLDPPGVTRDAYGAGEEGAHALCIEAAREAGLAVTRDFVGNTYATLAGTDPAAKTLIIGSHLDSVAHGGNYDGAAGVLAGLAALAGLVKANHRPRGDVTVMMTRAEETVWFPVSFPGSKAALGRLPAEALSLTRSDTGRTLAEHMRALGFDPDAIAAGRRHLDPARIAGFVEAHIEQGPELIEQDRAVAIVPSISGGFRFRQGRITGAYAHVGGAPKRARRDAVAALAHIIAGINAAWDRLDSAGHRLMATFGVIGVDPAMATWSRVPGEARFTLDVRSVDLPALEEMRRVLDALVAEAERKHGVTVTLGPDTGPRPGFLDDALVQRLRDCAAARGIATHEMPSGGGHDALAFHEAGVPAAMLFIRNQNGSHNPDEAMEMDDFAEAARILTTLAATH
jgi:N-carbamoyl-L-amino-acid hydrolase